MAAQQRLRPARNRILHTAARLFYARGLVATGIDTITAEAQVAKMSLYNNFASKEELELAYIAARHQELLEFYHQRLAQASDPLGRVLAMFDAYIDHASQPYQDGFRGCGLLNAAAEFPVNSTGRQMIHDYKQHIQDLLLAELKAAMIENSPDMAAHLAFLLEGAMVRAGLQGTIEHLRTARSIASTLLEAQCTKTE